jgi:hypothetical protein
MYLNGENMEKVKWNKYVENKTGILYNDIVDQLKGM